MRTKKGTLVLNMLSVGELCNQHEKHALAVADMIDRVLPRVYFQEAYPAVVGRNGHSRWARRSDCPIRTSCCSLAWSD